MIFLSLYRNLPVLSTIGGYKIGTVLVIVLLQYGRIVEDSISKCFGLRCLVECKGWLGSYSLSCGGVASFLGLRPAGKKCMVRPHRAQFEEDQENRGSSIKFGTSCANIKRPHLVWGPAESELFPAAPIHSTKISKLSLPQSRAFVIQASRFVKKKKKAMGENFPHGLAFYLFQEF